MSRQLDITSIMAVFTEIILLAPAADGMLTDVALKRHVCEINHLINTHKTDTKPTHFSI